MHAEEQTQVHKEVARDPKQQRAEKSSHRDESRSKRSPSESGSNFNTTYFEN